MFTGTADVKQLDGPKLIKLPPIKQDVFIKGMRLTSDVLLLATKCETKEVFIKGVLIRTQYHAIIQKMQLLSCLCLFKSPLCRTMYGDLLSNSFY